MRKLPATRKVHERDVEKALLDAVKAAGGEVRKVEWIGRRAAPDRFVMLPNFTPAFVELKAPGEKPTAEQAREHKKMRALGVRVFVIDSIKDALALMPWRVMGP
jgi:hypothetical protein